MFCKERISAALDFRRQQRTEETFSYPSIAFLAAPPAGTFPVPNKQQKQRNNHEKT
jgi:hypothetical protein